MRCEYGIFIRRHDANRDGGVGPRDHRVVRAISKGIDLKSEPGHARQHPFADRRGVLADAAGEDECVHATEHGDQTAERFPQEIAVEIDGLTRRGIRCFCSQQLAHIRGPT